MFLTPRPAKTLRWSLAILVGLFVLPELTPAQAQAEELTAQEIVRRSARNRTVRNSEQTLTMEIFDRNGRSRTRRIVSRVKEDDEGTSKSHVEFVEPEDVAGVQFLTIQNPKGEDLQWLFMPASGMLNQISGSTKKGSFMGSDFSFEDLSVGQVEDATHAVEPDTTIEVDGKSFATHVVASTPKPELGSAYTKIVSYIDKDQFIPRQVLFFDKKGENSKKMTIHAVEKRGDVVIPMRTTMENLKRGTRTEVRVDKVEVNVPAERLPDHLFTPESLQSEG